MPRVWTVLLHRQEAFVRVPVVWWGVSQGRGREPCFHTRELSDPRQADAQPQPPHP